MAGVSTKTGLTRYTGLAGFSGVSGFTGTSGSLGGGVVQPDEISGLKLWLDANDSSTISDTSGAVDTWTDKSGSGNNATSTGSNRPQTGARTINGKNAIDFDTSSVEFMSIADDTDFDHASGGFTVFIVGEVDNGEATADVFISKYRNNLGEEWILGYDTTNNLAASYSTDGSTTLNITGIDSIADNTPFIGGIVYSDGGSYELIHGRSISVASVTGITTTSGSQAVYLGAVVAGATTLDGAIAEVLYYNRRLTVSEINDVGVYLNSKWNADWTTVAYQTLSAITSKCICDLDSTIAASYGGTGTTWTNLTGDSAYNFTASGGISFSGTAGDAAAYFATDGTGIFTVAGGNTTLLASYHKSSGDHKISQVTAGQTDSTFTTTNFNGTGNGTSSHGWQQQLLTTGLRNRHLDGSSITNWDLTSDGGLGNSEDFLIGQTINYTDSSNASNSNKGSVNNSVLTPDAPGSLGTTTTDASDDYKILGVGALFTPSGFRLYHHSLYDDILTDAEWQAVVEQIKFRHSVARYGVD